MAISKDLADGYLDALISGDREGCKSIVHSLRSQNIPIMTIYESLFKKSLYEVGQLWEFNKISVAVEHLATSITEGLMNDLFNDVIANHREGKKAVIACVEKEDHQVGGKMVADVFEKNGWDTFFLGANTPMEELVDFCGLIQPDLISLSLSVYTNVTFLLKEIKLLQANYDCPILIGGQALEHKGMHIANQFNHVFYFNNLYDLETYVKGRLDYGKK